jgi:hypothetical protein
LKQINSAEIRLEENEEEEMPFEKQVSNEPSKELDLGERNRQ